MTAGHRVVNRRDGEHISRRIWYLRQRGSFEDQPVEQWQVAEESCDEHVLPGAPSKQKRTDFRFPLHASRAQRSDEEHEFKCATHQANVEWERSVRINSTVEKPVDDLDSAGQGGPLQQLTGEQGALQEIGNIGDKGGQLAHVATLRLPYRLLDCPGAHPAGGDPLRTVPRLPRRPTTLVFLGVDEGKGHGPGSFQNVGGGVRSSHRVIQRAGQVIDPALGNRPGNG